MAKTNKFGTFGGVFVPSILTILGVIMYLRLPMIVGEAGLWATSGHHRDSSRDFSYYWAQCFVHSYRSQSRSRRYLLYDFQKFGIAHRWHTRSGSIYRVII